MIGWEEGSESARRLLYVCVCHLMEFFSEKICAISFNCRGFKESKLFSERKGIERELSGWVEVEDIATIYRDKRMARWRRKGI